MRLASDYRLPAEMEEPLRRTQLKGIGAVSLSLLLVGVIEVFAGRRTGDPVGVAIDLACILAVLLTARSYSLAIALQRMALGRQAHKDKKPEIVVAALLPFTRGGILNTRSRFDKTGEAHYLLASAAKKLGEDELLAYCRVFLTRLRPGTWAKKAMKL